LKQGEGMTLRAEFYNPDSPDEVVGSALWTRAGVTVDAPAESTRERLGRIFRPTPVVEDDPSLRSFGTAGPSVLAPGSLRWFEAAARRRAAAEGLSVRFVVEQEAHTGWDPAGAYRPFDEQIERLAAL
jgi:hypothetical protein